MNNTPKTTSKTFLAYTLDSHSPRTCVFSSFAGRLELELNAANERIQQLEDRIERASIAFFTDGSDRQTAAAMLEILEEERNKP